MQKLILLILIALLFWSCDKNSVSVSSFDSEAEATESLTINFTTQTDLIIYNTNGNITITSSDTANSLYCDIVKKVKSKVSESDAQSHIPDIDISIEENLDNIKIEIDHPMNNERSYEISFDIVLPDSLNFEIAQGSGNITLKSTTKTTVISLGNGNVNTDLILEDTCTVSIAVGNGNIDLSIPGNTNAGLTATVGNGTISNNGLTFTNQQISNTQFNGTLGNGAGSITLSIGNGNIGMIKK